MALPQSAKSSHFHLNNTKKPRVSWDEGLEHSAEKAVIEIDTRYLTAEDGLQCQHSLHEIASNSTIAGTRG